MRPTARRLFAAALLLVVPMLFSGCIVWPGCWWHDRYPPRMATFHVYVCVAFLLRWSDMLCGLDFQETMLALQHLPARAWTDVTELEEVISTAFLYEQRYTRNHLAAAAGKGS